MNLKKILTEASDSAKEAHNRGWIYGGHGYWKNAQGQTVAKTVKGKLVPYTSTQKLLTKKRTPTNKNPLKKASKSNNFNVNNSFFPTESLKSIKIKKKQDYSIPHNLYTEYTRQRLQETRSLEFYTEPEDNIVKNIIHSANISNTVDEFIQSISESMNTFLTSPIMVGGQKWDFLMKVIQAPSTTPAGAEGIDGVFFDQTRTDGQIAREIIISPKMGRYMSAFKDLLKLNDPEYVKSNKQRISDMLYALKTIVHENVHAKSKNVRLTGAPALRNLDEGLTETKARRFLAKIVPDTLKNSNIINMDRDVYRSIYQFEVDKIKDLESITDLPMINEIWYNGNQRNQLVSYAIDQFIHKNESAIRSSSRLSRLSRIDYKQKNYYEIFWDIENIDPSDDEITFEDFIGEVNHKSKSLMN